MADWTNLPNTAVGVGGLPSGTTVTALRDNPIAIAEGAAGAPRIAFSAIVDGVAGAAVGAVGTYAFLRGLNNTFRDPGTTTAGSNLFYSNASGSTNTSPSGTWRLMGQTESSTAADVNTSLWLRIL